MYRLSHVLWYAETILAEARVNESNGDKTIQVIAK